MIKKERMSSKEDLLELKADLRDRVCVGPRYPGKPTMYRYEVRESCVNVSKPPSSISKLDKKVSSSSKLSSASSASNEYEIAEIRKVLTNQYVEGEPQEERKVKVSAETLFVVFSMMVSPHFRQKYPDPQVRYIKIVTYELGRPPPPMRFRILLLVLTHLEAMSVSSALSPSGEVPLPGRGSFVQRKPVKPKKKLVKSVKPVQNLEKKVGSKP
jgi:hypothetical protein